MANVNIENLRKEYASASIVAVDDINLDLDHGKFYSLLGASGCGKSTTLRCIAGLETPTSGTIRLDGEDITDQPPQQRDIDMVFQDIALFPHMTCRKNIEYGLRITGTPKEEYRAAAEEAAEVLEIADQLDKKPSELSGGQQQRVALARIFVKEPEVLLLDEPMSDLDAQLKERLRVELQRLHNRLDTTIIYVTHDQTEAMAMSDEIILMNEGQIEQVSSPDKMFNQPQTEHAAKFIGTPSTNIVDYEVENGEVRLPDLGKTVDIPLSPTIETSSRIGIRPRKFKINAGDIQFRITVDVIESLGNEYVLHSSTEKGGMLDLVVEDVDDISTAESLLVGVDLDDIFIFDDDGTKLEGWDTWTDDQTQNLGSG